MVWNAISYVRWCRAGSSTPAESNGSGRFVPPNLPVPALLRLLFLLHLEQCIGDRVRQVYEAVVVAEGSGPGAKSELEAVTAAFLKQSPVVLPLQPEPATTPEVAEPLLPPTTPVSSDKKQKKGLGALTLVSATKPLQLPKTTRLTDEPLQVPKTTRLTGNLKRGQPTASPHSSPKKKQK